MSAGSAAGSARLIELQDLEVVIAVANGKAFRHAARTLGVEPSAVSRRIRALEDRLGVSLFERSHSGVRLTIAGGRFLSDIRSALAQIERATTYVREAGSGANGAITVGIVGGLASHLLSTLLRQFTTEYPAVRLELVEGLSDTHVESVVNRTLDIAFVLGTPKGPEHDVEVMLDEALFVALRSSDPRLTGTSVLVDALARDHFIVATYAQGQDAEDFLIRELSEAGFTPNVTHHSVGREALMLMVGLGLGTALACQAETKVAYPNVSFVRLHGKSVPISAIWSPDNDNPALRRFLSLTRRLSREETKIAAASRTPGLSP